MKSFIIWGLRISILTFLILHLFTAFFPFPILLNVLSISGILIFLFTLGMTPLKQFKLPLFILISGIVILSLSNAIFFAVFLLGILQMRIVIGFLIVIPVIRWIL